MNKELRKGLVSLGLLVALIVFREPIGHAMSWGIMQFANGVAKIMQPGIDEWAQGLSERHGVPNLPKESEFQKIDDVVSESGQGANAWKVRDVGAVYIKYPADWYFYEYNIITNMPIADGEWMEENLRDGEVRIGLSGAPVDQIDSGSATLAQGVLEDFVVKNDGVCEIEINVSDTEDLGFAACYLIDRSNVRRSYLQVKRMEPDVGMVHYGANYVIIRFADMDTLEQNVDMVDAILNSYFVFDYPFMPFYK